MKSKISKLFPLISGLLMLIATIGIKPASWTTVYQPKAPKCLDQK